MHTDVTLQRVKHMLPHKVPHKLKGANTDHPTFLMEEVLLLIRKIKYLGNDFCL
jgi:hypothetical protein